MITASISVTPMSPAQLILWTIISWYPPTYSPFFSSFSGLSYLCLSFVLLCICFHPVARQHLSDDGQVSNKFMSIAELLTFLCQSYLVPPHFSEPCSFPFLAIQTLSCMDFMVWASVQMSHWLVPPLSTEPPLLQHIFQAGQVVVKSFRTGMVSQSHQWKVFLVVEDGLFRLHILQYKQSFLGSLHMFQEVYTALGFYIDPIHSTIPLVTPSSISFPPFFLI